MGPLNAIEQRVQDFVFNVAAKRALVVAGQVAVAFAVAHLPQLQALAGQVGVTISADPTAVAAGVQTVLTAGAHFAGHWLAAKFPKAFGWMGV